MLNLMQTLKRSAKKNNTLMRQSVFSHRMDSWSNNHYPHPHPDLHLHYHKETYQQPQDKHPRFWQMSTNRAMSTLCHEIPNKKKVFAIFSNFLFCLINSSKLNKNEQVCFFCGKYCIHVTDSFRALSLALSLVGNILEMLSIFK